MSQNTDNSENAPGMLNSAESRSDESPWSTAALALPEQATSD